jgi:hypothetical protein
VAILICGPCPTLLRIRAIEAGETPPARFPLPDVMPGDAIWNLLPVPPLMWMTATSDRVANLHHQAATLAA